MPARPLALLATLLLTLVLAACGDDDAQQASSGDTTTTSTTSEPGPGNGDGGDGDRPDEPECSGAEIMTTMEFPGDVPEPVATTLLAIRSAAQSCDYDELGELAFADGTFTASFGLDFEGAEDLAAHWRQEEQDRDEPVTATIVHLTTMSRAQNQTTDATGEELTMYVAPRAFAEDDEAARQEVIDVFGPEAEAWFVDEGYVGWRIGITEDGDWRFFVQGD